MTYDDQLKFFCFYKSRERQLEATATIALLIGRLTGWPLDKMAGLWNNPLQLLCMSLHLYFSISPYLLAMPAKKNDSDKPLEGKALVKEVCRRIRVARSYWDAHNNRACRGERDKAIKLYETLDKAQREQVPQVLRVWLRYRSEKYFGEGGQ